MGMYWKGKQWLGHFLRGESLVKKVIEGRIEGKKVKGKLRTMLLDDIKINETDKMSKRRALHGETGCLEPALEQSANDDAFKRVILVNLG